MSKSAVSWILVVGCAAFWAGYLVPRDSGTVERSDRARQERNAAQDQRIAEQEQSIADARTALKDSNTLLDSLRARLSLLEKREQEQAKDIAALR